VKIEIVIENVRVSNSAKHNKMSRLSTSTQPTTDEGDTACQWAAREDNEKQRAQAPNQQVSTTTTHHTTHPHLLSLFLHRKGGCSPTSLHLLAAQNWATAAQF